MDSRRLTRTVACAQMAGAGGSLDDRLARIETFTREAKARGAVLLVLPEMSAAGYDLRREMHAEALAGSGVGALVEIARRADLHLVAGITERDGHDRYNALALVGPSGFIGAYRKLHVSAVENAFWACGRGPSIVPCDLGRIGFGICADMLFPTPWRAYAGAVDLVVIAAAWPDHRHTVPFPYGDGFSATHVEATREVPLHLSRTLGVPVMFANAAGSFSARLPPFSTPLRGRFAGRSCIVDGSVVARADTEEALIVGSVGVSPRPPAGSLEPWIPGWSASFRLAAQLGDSALGAVYRAFYRPETGLKA